MRSIKESILCTSVSVAAVLAGALLVAPVASALSPWWHVTSGSRPSQLQTDVHSGLARDEVQKLTVSATAGTVTILEPASVAEVEEGEGELKEVSFPYNATHQAAQAALEGIYGAGNVEVTGGPGDATGGTPYVVTFKGELADQPLELMNTQLSMLTGGASVSESTAGRADGEVFTTVVNLGDALADGSGTPIQIKDTPPAGLKAVAIMARRYPGSNYAYVIPCSRQTLTCTFQETVLPYEPLEVRVLVVAEPMAKSGELNGVSVSGGGAPAAAVQRPITVGEGPTPYGIEHYELTPEEEGGAQDAQAGSHPFQTTFTIGLNQEADTAGADNRSGGGGKPEVFPAQLTKDLHFKLPPGLIGNPTPIPQCTVGQFLNEISSKESPTHNYYQGNECAPQTAIGMVTIDIYEPSTLGYFPFIVPIVQFGTRIRVSRRGSGFSLATCRTRDLHRYGGAYG